MEKIKISEYKFKYYFNRGYSSEKISKIFNISKRTAQLNAERFGLKFIRKTQENYRIQKAVFKTFKKHGYSIEEAVELLNMKYTKRYYKVTKLKEIKINERKEELVNDYQISLLVGCFLGDGYIGTNNKFVCEHGSQQREYSLWKAQQLRGFDVTYREYLREYSNTLVPNYTGCTFDVKDSLGILKWIKDISYNPVKIITNELLKHYNDLSLAVQFMDDGYKSKETVVICTMGFDLNSINLLITFLKKRFDLYFYITTDNNIRLGMEDYEKFKKIVSPYIVDCMKYKINE